MTRVINDLRELVPPWLIGAVHHVDGPIGRTSSAKWPADARSDAGIEPTSLEPAALRQPPTLEQLQNIWRHVVLDADAKARLLNCIQRFNSQAAVPPRGLLIHGAPGTGKTEIIRHIAESVSGAFMGLTLKDLADRYVGQTASLVQEGWRKARSYGRCVITLDWCEGIFAGPGTPRGGASEELVSVFRAQWDESVEHGAGRRELEASPMYAS
jgi:AAA family ATPase